MEACHPSMVTLKNLFEKLVAFPPTASRCLPLSTPFFPFPLKKKSSDDFRSYHVSRTEWEMLRFPGGKKTASPLLPLLLDFGGEESKDGVEHRHSTARR